MARKTAAKRTAKPDPKKVHKDAILVDGMGVAVLLPTALIPQPASNRGVPFLDRAIESGVTSMNVCLGILGIGMGEDNFRAMVNTMYGHYCLFEMEPRLIHVLTGDDVRRAKREKKIGVIFGCQGMASKIEGDPGLIAILHRLGQRIGQIAYNSRDAIGCGALEEPDTGLTEFGRIVIREMNHVGMLVDLAHASHNTLMETIERSKAPVIVSHANVRALCNHTRNLTDDGLRALADCGGVVGITAYSPFCETTPGVRPKLDDYIDHVAYVADLVGVDHVGIGSDFFEGESNIRFERFFRTRYPELIRNYVLDTVYVDGFSKVDHLPKLTAGLLRRGFAPAEVKKILGGNFLRVFDQVWKV